MENLYKEKLKSVLPPSSPGSEDYRERLLEEQSRQDARKLTAAELAKKLSEEKRRLKEAEPGSRQAAVAALRVEAMETVIGKAPDILAPSEELKGELPELPQSPVAPERMAGENPYLRRATDKTDTPRVDAVIESITAEPVLSASPAHTSRLQSRPQNLSENVLRSVKGSLRPATARLMTALNINLESGLSRRETADLIAALLTCNETQLDALMANKKTPMAVKIIIKRIKDDFKNGSLSTVNNLWDRIFGREPLSADSGLQSPLSAADSVRTAVREGRLPDVPVSREAYILIRDTLIK